MRNLEEAYSINNYLEPSIIKKNLEYKNGPNKDNAT